MNTLPHWNQLPDLDLYLDQVLLYVNQHTSPFIADREKPLTASMVNNYVKHGYIPKPVKKKYQREHLAYLIILSICKPIFSIADIQAAIEQLTVHYQTPDLFDAFVDCFSSLSTSSHPLMLQKLCQTIHTYQEVLLLLSDERRLS